MRDVNMIFLIGRLGRDPVLRETKAGQPVAHFSLATSRRKKDEAVADGFTEETTWHQVVVWGKQAEVCNQYLQKGDAVWVEGNLRSRRFQNKEGQERTIFEVHADSVNFLTQRKRPDGELEAVPAQAESQAA
jgi:single-strand DNA-binding protein